jgi:hypothetical protein
MGVETGEKLAEQQLISCKTQVYLQFVWLYCGSAQGFELAG